MQYLAAALAVLALLAACSTPSTPSVPPSSAAGFVDAALYLCSGMRVSNAPPHERRRVLGYKPFVNVNGVALATAPTRGACLSSGFGQRGGRLHKGLDLHRRAGGAVYAAGYGKVLEAHRRRGYGNTVLIDHGRGVFTRYAHLAGFAPGARVGRRVAPGTVIGQMGNSGNATAIHLHYELLRGNYQTALRSFGLKAHSPFSYPSY